jgi:hypothetical protein
VISSFRTDFSNVTIVTKTGSDNPDNLNQIYSISPAADGSVAAKNTAITVTILKAN